MAGRAPSLEAIGMTKVFGSFTALGDVSIDVKAGSFHALLGENGAGARSGLASVSLAGAFTAVTPGRRRRWRPRRTPRPAS